MKEFAEAYRIALQPLLEAYCEVQISEQQLAGFQRQLERKGVHLTTEEACPYYEAEGWILKAAFGCVETQIRQAQTEARQAALSIRSTE